LKEIKAKAAKKKHDPLYALAVKLITQCVASPAVADLLDKRSPETVVWREQKAALIHEGKMIDAVFDRVHIVPGKEAVIIDYKTNDCDEAELREIYAGQMELYRISVAELCGIPHENIRCILIHVRHGTLVEI
jgi:ATP-dependent exoDNAse (exonuclease V) beta subunit